MIKEVEKWRVFLLIRDCLFKLWMNCLRFWKYFCDNFIFEIVYYVINNRIFENKVIIIVVLFFSMLRGKYWNLNICISNF